MRNFGLVCTSIICVGFLILYTCALCLFVKVATKLTDIQVESPTGPLGLNGGGMDGETSFDCAEKCETYKRMSGDRGQAAMHEEIRRVFGLREDDDLIIDFSPNGVYRKSIKLLVQQLNHHDCSCVIDMTIVVTIIGFIIGAVLMSVHLYKSQDDKEQRQHPFRTYIKKFLASEVKKGHGGEFVEEELEHEVGETGLGQVESEEDQGRRTRVSFISENSVMTP